MQSKLTGTADLKDDATITQALHEVRVRILTAEDSRAELDRVIAAAREEEKLLLRVLALRRGDLPIEPSDPIDGSSAESARAVSHDDSKHLAVRAVVRELAAAGRPLHISDLMRLLQERKVRIPGAGTQANLITHLRRDPRLVRPSRGMYGLRVWGLENMPIKAPHKRRKRRVRSKGAMEGT